MTEDSTDPTRVGETWILQRPQAGASVSQVVTNEALFFNWQMIQAKTAGSQDWITFQPNANGQYNTLNFEPRYTMTVTNPASYPATFFQKTVLKGDNSTRIDFQLGKKIFGRVGTNVVGEGGVANFFGLANTRVELYRRIDPKAGFDSSSPLLPYPGIPPMFDQYGNHQSPLLRIGQQSKGPR